MLVAEIRSVTVKDRISIAALRRRYWERESFIFEVQDLLTFIYLCQLNKLTSIGLGGRDHRQFSKPKQISFLHEQGRCKPNRHPTTAPHRRMVNNCSRCLGRERTRGGFPVENRSAGPSRVLPSALGGGRAYSPPSPTRAGLRGSGPLYRRRPRSRRHHRRRPGSALRRRPRCLPCRASFHARPPSDPRQRVRRALPGGLRLPPLSQSALRFRNFRGEERTDGAGLPPA